MVTASSNGKKKKAKKSTKRKPVNLQSNFTRKCTTTDTTDDVMPGGTLLPFEHHDVALVRADMFPTNDHTDEQHHACNHRTATTNGDDATRDDAVGSCGDFHLHSLCSDGKLKPSDVIAKAAANGVTYMSLTDHDTMAGVADAIATAQALNVLVIPGVEISAEVAGGENLHILGYFYPGSNSTALETQLEKIRTGRHKRGKGMLAKLASMGIKLEWSRVLEIAGEAAPGRPHVAQALVEGGFVANFRDAFARFLHNDGPAYVEGEHFPPADAIELIASAGGVSVLAHPWCCKNPLTLVPELAKLGIQGVEVFHDTNKIDTYGFLATESGLLQMGGSDFHGIDPLTERAPGAIPFPRKHVERFLAHAKSVWEKPLRARLEAIVADLKDEKDEGDNTLLIWRDQLPAAQQVCTVLGASVETVEDDESASLYRTLRISVVSPSSLPSTAAQVSD